MNVTCIIPAAGKGSRFGGDIPKQFVHIHGKMILEYAIASLIDGLKSCHINPSLIIACEQDRSFELQTIAQRYLESDHIAIVQGGKERKDSIAHAVSSPLALASDKLMIHDAARPFVPSSVIKELLEASRHTDCVIPTMPIPDTIKNVKDHCVLNTIDRSSIKLAQTPQIVDTKKYIELVHSNQHQLCTDDASIMEYGNHTVHCINGHEMMRKITYPYDVLIAELHLSMYLNQHES